MMNTKHSFKRTWIFVLLLLHIAIASFSQNNGIFLGGNGDGLTLGTLGVGGEVPLPIELLSFAGRVVKDGVELTWETASESENDFFFIEESVDGEKFRILGKVKGAGTSYTLHRYEFINPKPASGLSYYRLRQTDYDGTFTYSKVISVRYQDHGSIVSVFPNPVHGDDLTIEVIGPGDLAALPVLLLDQAGRIYFSESVENQAYFIKTLSVRDLANGIYILKIGAVNKKIVVAR